MDILSHLSEKKYTVQYFKVWKEGFIESLIQNVMKKFYAKQFTDNSKKKMYMYSHLLV